MKYKLHYCSAIMGIHSITENICIYILSIDKCISTLP